jgi:hypothetical protein
MLDSPVGALLSAAAPYARAALIEKLLPYVVNKMQDYTRGKGWKTATGLIGAGKNYLKQSLGLPFDDVTQANIPVADSLRVTTAAYEYQSVASPDLVDGGALGAIFAP